MSSSNIWIWENRIGILGLWKAAVTFQTLKLAHHIIGTQNSWNSCTSVQCGCSESMNNKYQSLADWWNRLNYPYFVIMGKSAQRVCLGSVISRYSFVHWTKSSTTVFIWSLLLTDTEFTTRIFQRMWMCISVYPV